LKASWLSQMIVPESNACSRQCARQQQTITSGYTLTLTNSAHGTPGSAKSPADLKRPRACDSCRGLKVRCDQERPDVSCRRCAKAGRPCITTPPTRKRQKKADSRVAELERKIDALTATLHAQKAGAPEIRHHGGIPQPGASADSMPMPVEGQYRMGSLEHDWSQPPAGRYPDIPPGYGPAQNMQRAPEPKRRKLDNTSHAVSSQVKRTRGQS
jgi:hypothetical protein